MEMLSTDDRRVLTVDMGQRSIPVPPKVVTPSLLRQYFTGALDLAAFPLHLANQLKAIAARVRRQEARWMKREYLANNYAVDASRGGGTRECARRRRQIEAGSLRVENGLVT
jgi:hypothetical protein